VDFVAVLAAAARFRRAWIEATSGPEPLFLPDPRVSEVHDAARELMEATETADLRATFDALDELVRRTGG
jgi:hypothetical protein